MALQRKPESPTVPAKRDPRPDVAEVAAGARDSLDAIHVAIAAVVLLVVRTRFPITGAAVLWTVAIVLISPAVDWLIDPRVREIVASTGLLCGWTGLAAIWPWHGRAWAGLAALTVWMTVTVGFRHFLKWCGRFVRGFERRHNAWIGRRRNAVVERAFGRARPTAGRLARLIAKARTKADRPAAPSSAELRQVDAAWEDFLRVVGLPSGTKFVEKGTNELGRFIRMQLPAQPIAWSVGASRAAYARRVHLDEDQVHIGTERGDASALIIQEHTRTRFARVPAVPAVGPDEIALGYEEGLATVAVDITGDDAHHVLIGGRTRGGKTGFLRWLLNQWLLKGAELWIIDPKRGTAFRRYRHLAARWATVDGRSLLEELLVEMYRRFDEMESRAIDAWDGNWIVCAIDEIGAVMVDPPTERGELKGQPIAETMRLLLQMAAQAKIVILAATTSPRADLVGGGAAKGGFLMRAAFGAENMAEVRIMLWEGAVRDGWNPMAIDRTAKGRCIITGVPDVGTVEMQTWWADGPPANLPGRPVSTGGPIDVHLAGLEAVQDTPMDSPVDTPMDGLVDGLPPQAAAVLAALEHTPASGRAIAKRAGCSPTTALTILRALADRGLAHERTDPAGWALPEAA